ncbi:MAG: lipopolysaccharide biosynthesis protein [Anaerolineaceae bacterium]|nr:lipopolysaccharide biosynthesis protein [Anaerolineaceae bacterium]
MLSNSPQEENKGRRLAVVTLNGTLWSYASFFCGKLMVFISTIILARLLSKDDFGVMSYALVVMSFMDILSDFGIGQAVIYHKNDQDTPDTAFWLGMIISTSMLVITWIAAPLVGQFFHDQRAVLATRALAITFPIDAFGNVHNMLLRKKFSFGRKFIPEFIKAVCKGGIAILLAVLGYGFWSLVAGQIAGAIAADVAFWWVMPWRPSFHFIGKAARQLLSYGGSLVAVDIFSIVYSNADYVLIGHFMSAASLGVYTLAFGIPDLVINQLCNVISQVVFPVFVNIQDEIEALRQGFLTSIRYIALITIPLGLGLALVSKPMILALFTDKWIEAIPVLRAISIYAMLLSLGYSAGIVYKAQGRPHVLTVVEFIRAFITVPALAWVVLSIGTIEAVGWTQALIASAAMALDLSVACRMLKLPLKSIAGALAPALLSGAVMSLAVLGAMIVFQQSLPVIELAVSVVCGAVVYFSILWIFQRNLLVHAGNTLRLAITGSKA